MTQPDPTLTELELREQLYNAMDGNLRMSRRRHLLDAYREAILASASAVVAPADRAELRDRIAEELHAQMPGCTHDEHGSDCGALADAVLPALVDRPAVLSESERTMLTYALDQAQEKIWSEGGFTDEDQAAVTSLRRLAGETPTATDADRLTTVTAPALLATIKELRDLRAPLIDALTTVYQSMTSCVGDEWAMEWLGEVWSQLPLNVRAAAGDQDAAHELAAAGARQDGARTEADRG